MTRLNARNDNFNYRLLAVVSFAITAFVATFILKGASEISYSRRLQERQCFLNLELCAHSEECCGDMICEKTFLSLGSRCRDASNESPKRIEDEKEGVTQFMRGSSSSLSSSSESSSKCMSKMNPCAFDDQCCDGLQCRFLTEFASLGKRCYGNDMIDENASLSKREEEEREIVNELERRPLHVERMKDEKQTKENEKETYEKRSNSDYEGSEPINHQSFQSYIHPFGEDPVKMDGQDRPEPKKLARNKSFETENNEREQSSKHEPEEYERGERAELDKYAREERPPQKTFEMKTNFDGSESISLTNSEEASKKSKEIYDHMKQNEKSYERFDYKNRLADAKELMEEDERRKAFGFPSLPTRDHDQYQQHLAKQSYEEKASSSGQPENELHTSSKESENLFDKFLKKHHEEQVLQKSPTASQEHEQLEGKNLFEEYQKHAHDLQQNFITPPENHEEKTVSEEKNLFEEYKKREEQQTKEEAEKEIFNRYKEEYEEREALHKLQNEAEQAAPSQVEEPKHESQNLLNEFFQKREHTYNEPVKSASTPEEITDFNKDHRVQFYDLENSLYKDRAPPQQTEEEEEKEIKKELGEYEPRNDFMGEHKQEEQVPPPPPRKSINLLDEYEARMRNEKEQGKKSIQNDYTSEDGHNLLSNNNFDEKKPVIDAEAMERNSGVYEEHEYTPQQREGDGHESSHNLLSEYTLHKHSEEEKERENEKARHGYEESHNLLDVNMKKEMEMQNPMYQHSLPLEKNDLLKQFKQQKHEMVEELHEYYGDSPPDTDMNGIPRGNLMEEP